ncbi:hypothetical protein PAECIP111891_00103 [Paenibacillus allorhizoplanae]|uniref:Uncharacterized protein n=1 Tax=Paenibacillus allorhizoplanae TaxID=2905648 RepID=A0ABN8FTT9_9BACL|nr:hypothetical protein [Paenibacillus allorhizoplanae]CAH1191805.1 hypothetical protein PAECIP111891_00103 [Paenibacillus allorhizoplanae]
MNGIIMPRKPAALLRLIAALSLLIGLLPLLAAPKAEAATVSVANAGFETLSGSLPANWTLPYTSGYESSSINQTVTWGGSSSLSSLAGQTISVKYYMKNTKLYAMQFKN